MTLEQAARGGVDAVVVYDGRLLMVAAQDSWGLPSGAPQPAESAQAGAARLVYELTGYLVDGTSVLRSQGTAGEDARPAVVCQLLSQAPRRRRDSARNRSAGLRSPKPSTRGCPKPCGTTWWAIHPCRDAGAAFIKIGS